mmetsp:Transcript_7394/g.18201  ORF Transcript_7394/g.18201 Transcript_7394/m.18201 type:complete len:638 (-) Transcript_7394:95-2008(-)
MSFTTPLSFQLGLTPSPWDTDDGRRKGGKAGAGVHCVFTIIKKRGEWHSSFPRFHFISYSGWMDGWMAFFALTIGQRVGGLDLGFLGGALGGLVLGLGVLHGRLDVPPDLDRPLVERRLHLGKPEEHNRKVDLLLLLKPRQLLQIPLLDAVKLLRPRLLGLLQRLDVHVQLVHLSRLALVPAELLGLLLLQLDHLHLLVLHLIGQGLVGELGLVPLPEGRQGRGHEAQVVVDGAQLRGRVLRGRPHQAAHAHALGARALHVGGHLPDVFARLAVLAVPAPFLLLELGGLDGAQAEVAESVRHFFHALDHVLRLGRRLRQHRLQVLHLLLLLHKLLVEVQLAGRRVDLVVDLVPELLPKLLEPAHQVGPVPLALGLLGGGNRPLVAHQLLGQVGQASLPARVLHLLPLPALGNVALPLQEELQLARPRQHRVARQLLQVLLQRHSSDLDELGAVKLPLHHVLVRPWGDEVPPVCLVQPVCQRHELPEAPAHAQVLLLVLGERGRRLDLVAHERRADDAVLLRLLHGVAHGDLHVRGLLGRDRADAAVVAGGRGFGEGLALLGLGRGRAALLEGHRVVVAWGRELIVGDVGRVHRRVRRRERHVVQAGARQLVAQRVHVHRVSGLQRYVLRRLRVKRVV